MKRLGYLLFLAVLLLAICSSCCSKGNGSDASMGVVSAGASSIELCSAVAVLYEVAGDPHVEVTFFFEELSAKEREAVAEPGQFAKEVNGKPAVFSIGFWFDEGSTVCDLQNLVNYSVMFYDSDVLRVPADFGSAHCGFGAGGKAWEKGQFGVMELSGDLRRGETIKARVTYEQVYTMDLAPGVNSLPLKWDVEIDCPLRVRK
jgi:hypothetical protein